MARLAEWRDNKTEEDVLSGIWAVSILDKTDVHRSVVKGMIIVALQRVRIRCYQVCRILVSLPSHVVWVCLLTSWGLFVHRVHLANNQAPARPHHPAINKSIVQ
jgi:hypothetical protein